MSFFPVQRLEAIYLQTSESIPETHSETFQYSNFTVFPDKKDNLRISKAGSFQNLPGYPTQTWFNAF